MYRDVCMEEGVKWRNWEGEREGGREGGRDGGREGGRERGNRRKGCMRGVSWGYIGVKCISSVTCIPKLFNIHM